MIIGLIIWLLCLLCGTLGGLGLLSEFLFNPKLRRQVIGRGVVLIVVAYVTDFVTAPPNRDWSEDIAALICFLVIAGLFTLFKAMDDYSRRTGKRSHGFLVCVIFGLIVGPILAHFLEK